MPSPQARPAEQADDGPDRTLLTVEQAAHQLSLGRTTLYALINTGAITSIKIGRLRRIPTHALTEYTTRLTTEQHTS